MIRKECDDVIRLFKKKSIKKIRDGAVVPWLVGGILHEKFQKVGFGSMNILGWQVIH
jgi:hypothetical protein